MTKYPDTTIRVEREATRYPADALAAGGHDVIAPDAHPTLAAVFRERVRRSPTRTAYREFDTAAGMWRDYTWTDMAREVARWQAAMDKEGLQPGDRVALRMRNRRHWVVFDQAALGLGLVVVPLYVDDRADNVAYIVADAQAKLLLLEHQDQWDQMQGVREQLAGVERVVILEGAEGADDARVVGAEAWLPAEGGGLQERDAWPDQLATIVYTSGTTGRPKGVMLSHTNIVSNTYAGLQSVAVRGADSMLSFLPLSHTLERTAGYYMALMSGASVAYARSIPDLPEDLTTICPSVLVSVPRIYERVYGRIKAQLEEGPPLKKALFEKTVEVGWNRFEWKQGRAPWQPQFLLWPLLYRLVAKKVHAKLGGRVRIAISGGAPLPPAVSKVFIGLGLNLLQGYGLTESSPIISVDTPEHNLPASIGLPLRGVRVRVGEGDELLAKGPNIMLGYWNNEAATRQTVDADGWLHTGDRARIENGFIHIIGRIKEIIVLANGEKVPPSDMEQAIAEDPLFDQSLVIGEGKPYLSAILVLNAELWPETARSLGLSPNDPASLQSDKLEQHLLERIGAQLHDFPGYAQIRRATPSLDAWTIESGLTTPTMKIRRARVMEHFHAQVDRMYAGH